MNSYICFSRYLLFIKTVFHIDHFAKGHFVRKREKKFQYYRSGWESHVYYQKLENFIIIRKLPFH